MGGKRTILFWIGKVLLLLGMLSFFLSFSVSEVNIISGHSKSFTGAYIIHGLKDDADLGEYTDETLYKGAETASVIVTAALVFTAAGLVLPILSWLPSLFAAGTMVVFGVFCRYANDELSELYPRKVIDLRPAYGAYIFMALVLLSAVLTITDTIIRKRRKSGKVSA